jgi:hypothetical protein
MSEDNADADVDDDSSLEAALDGDRLSLRAHGLLPFLSRFWASIHSDTDVVMACSDAMTLLTWQWDTEKVCQ